MYFDKILSIPELKKLYFQLAKKHHPDNGGDAEIFKQISAEFSARFEWLKAHSASRQTAKDSTANSANNHHSSRAKSYATETPKKFIEIIDKLLRIKGIEIEIVGDWIWLSGDTYNNRQMLKILGCRFSKGRKQWYWTFSPYHKQHSKLSNEEIRNLFGSQFIKRQPEEVLLH